MGPEPAAPPARALRRAGRRALAGRGRWVPCRPGFFLPVHVLGALFRGKYLALLGESHRQGKLAFHGKLRPLAEAGAFAALMREARSRRWVVYAKPPFGGAEPALKYLARYTHRIAISNARLLSVTETEVAFSWKDYAHGEPHPPY